MSQELEEQRVVVIGAGQSGFEVCAKLRALGHRGPITLVGEEAHPPYQRPPLSKAYLLGKMELSRLFFRPRDFYETQGIDLHLSLACDAIDRDNQLVRLSDGSSLPYDALVLATGSRPVRLPSAIGGDLKGVHYVRDLTDADRMSEDMQPGRRVLIVGGGYIGLEAAAVAAGLGLKVILVEAADRILQRVASEKTSDFFRDLHVEQNVEIREGVMLDRLKEENGQLVGAVLSDGSELDLDVAVVGIGIRPNMELAEAAGLETENGIKVDELCRSSDPKIYAAGDCASFPHQGQRIRLESVGNAIDQAHVVARSILGEQEPYTPKPWFWSDQYDTKLQIAGLSTGHDQVCVRTGDKDGVSFWYFRENRLIAVDAINEPRAYMIAKRLIEGGKHPHPDRIENPDTDLKALLKE